MTIPSTTNTTAITASTEDAFEDEVEIMPGIYLSKLKKPRQEPELKDYQVREQSKTQRIEELKHSIEKLKYSNQEIKKQMELDDDVVYQESLDENEGLIERKQAELKELMPKEIDTEIVLDSDQQGLYL
jgi:hypothetical protein